MIPEASLRNITIKFDPDHLKKHVHPFMFVDRFGEYSVKTEELYEFVRSLQEMMRKAAHAN